VETSCEVLRCNSSNQSSSGPEEKVVHVRTLSLGLHETARDVPVFAELRAELTARRSPYAGGREAASPGLLHLAGPQPQL